MFFDNIFFDNIFLDKNRKNTFLSLMTRDEGINERFHIFKILIKKSEDMYFDIILTQIYGMKFI